MTARSENTVSVKTTESAKVVAYPPNYWEYKDLNLYYKSESDCSVDDAGAKRYKTKASAPLGYVKGLQADLIKIGYLDGGKDDGYFGGQTRRAITRFQRHSKRVYRMIGEKPDDVSPDGTFAGSITGVCDFATAKQVRQWIAKGWVVPVGRFPKKALRGDSVGHLRADAADEWDKLVATVIQLGGTLAGPYGDTVRTLKKFSKSGTSSYSFHYCGRAVDIRQGESRYHMAKVPVDGEMRWKIYCRTNDQSGKQGYYKKKGEVKCWSFYSKKEYDLKEGYYINLTSVIHEHSLFRRIASQRGWEGDYNKIEWWHFQYERDIQETFEDELELFGYTEAEIRKAGWAKDSELDHAPG